MLGDLDYKLCETALMELFATHTYPPQISEIREKCAEYTVPHLKDQGEAWGEVQKAISQYGYYRQEEALESLTPIVREAVKRLGFREICLDENQDAVRAHFFKIYSSLIERKTNDAKLPPSILEAKNKYIAQLTTQENVAIEQQHREQIAEEPERATPEYEERIEKKISAEERLPGDMYNMQTTMENKDNMIARLEKELSTVQSKKTKAIEALAKLRLEKQKIAGESKGNEVVRAWAEAVVKAREGENKDG